MPDIIAFFEQKIGIRIAKKQLWTEAVTHSSYANENGCICNERLEFLGDSVLSIVVSEQLFRHKPSVSEGDMTRIRAMVVCEETLAACARNIGLGTVLRLGRGEMQTGGAERPSVLADALEAVIAALYLEMGLAKTQAWVSDLLKESLAKAFSERGARDYKTALQEKFQKKDTEALLYKVISEEGPDHAKIFTVEVSLAGKTLGRGTGKSKKAAEQAAAQMAFEALL